MIAIANYIPNPVDSTSFYRGVGPMADMRRQRGDTMLNFQNDTNWANLSMSDIAFIQRPYKTEHLVTAQMCKDLNVPLWVDYDDFLFNLPGDNPAYFIYMRKEIQENIKRIIQLADVVTVSTHRLKECFQLPGHEPLNKNVIVIPNAWDRRKFPNDPDPKFTRSIMWRGSNTHSRDLAVFAQEIIDASHESKDWVWNFIGWNPWFITERMSKKNVFVTEALDIIEFHRMIRKVSAAIMIIPLDFSVFNECKSNIAWMEGTYAGSTCLAPDTPEWRKPGVILYKNPKEFQELLKVMLSKDGVDFKAHNKLSWKYMQENLFLHDVNKIRIQIVDALLGKAEFPAGQLKQLHSYGMDLG